MKNWLNFEEFAEKKLGVLTFCFLKGALNRWQGMTNGVVELMACNHFLHSLIFFRRKTSRKISKIQCPRSTCIVPLRITLVTGDQI